MKNDRFLRQTMLKEVGEEGQRRLDASSVLIVGVGGLGSVVATYLNGAGVGHIGLIDSDVVSLNNLHRQFIYTEAEVGEPKAQCAARFLAARSEGVEIQILDERLTPANAERLIADYDVVVDCTDNYATRFLIDDACAAVGKSWVYGAIGGFDGQVSVFGRASGFSGNAACRRFADLYPDREYLCGLPPFVSGVLGPQPGVIGSLQAMEALKLLLGIPSPLSGKLFTINTLTLKTNLIDF